VSAAPVLKAGVIGAGWIGRRHAETISGRGDIEVAAVCDVHPGRAAEVAGLSGAATAAASPPGPTSCARPAGPYKPILVVNCGSCREAEFEAG
jgi:hypothetical protein